MEEKLEERCKFVIDVAGEPFCRIEMRNLNIEPCPITCVEYLKGLYRNIDSLACEVYEREVIE